MKSIRFEEIASSMASFLTAHSQQPGFRPRRLQPRPPRRAAFEVSWNAFGVVGSAIEIVENTFEFDGNGFEVVGNAFDATERAIDADSIALGVM